MSPPRKAPSAVTERAQRLELLRFTRGLESVREFWHELQHEGHSISYEAVRNYHRDRDAPVDYYVAVASVFSVNLIWLLTGRGDMERAVAALDGDDTSEDPAGQILAEAINSLNFLDGMRSDARSLFSWTLLDLLSLSWPDWDLITVEDIQLRAEWLWHMVMTPWMLLNLQGVVEEQAEESPVRTATRNEELERIRHYMLSMYTAIRSAIPPDSAGNFGHTWLLMGDVAAETSKIVVEAYRVRDEEAQKDKE